MTVASYLTSARLFSLFRPTGLVVSSATDVERFLPRQWKCELTKRCSKHGDGYHFTSVQLFGGGSEGDHFVGNSLTYGFAGWIPVRLAFGICWRSYLDLQLGKHEDYSIHRRIPEYLDGTERASAFLVTKIGNNGSSH